MSSTLDFCARPSSGRQAKWLLLSRLWWFPSLGAAVILARGFSVWIIRNASGGWHIPIDGVAAIIILILQLAWLFLARRNDKPSPPLPGS